MLPVARHLSSLGKEGGGKKKKKKAFVSQNPPSSLSLSLSLSLLSHPAPQLFLSFLLPRFLSLFFSRLSSLLPL